MDKLTNPLPQPPVPGAIFASPSFSLFFGCHCADGGAPPTLTDNGISGSWKCPSGGSEDSEGGGGGGGDDTGLVAAVVVVVVVLALLLLGISGYLLRNVQPGAQSRSQQQAELSRKRSKVPGTPGVALQAGQGLVVSGDVLVTWVCTDVADSTWLWEWDAEVMDQAIAMHNTTIRELLEEQGGHEIRNEGDSFVMSFHDASDAVRFCLQVQERLLQLPWPPKLLSIPQAACRTMGDVSDNPSSKGQGPLIIAGLRVRIGINTGVPDDVFLHNVTEHVDYRGNEYDLAGQICDIADGGQILMGPKTYQRWNKCCTDTPDETNHHQASFEGPMSTEDTRFQRTSIMGRFASQTGRRQSMLAMKSIQSRNPRLGSTSERLMRVREMNGASPTASGIDLPMDPQSRTNASSARRSHSGTEVFPDGCRFPQDLPAGSPPMSLQASRIAPSSTLPGPISESFISPLCEFWNRAASLPPDGTSSLALSPLNLHQQQCVDPQGQQQQPRVHPQPQLQQQQQQQQQPYFHSLHAQPEQQPQRQQLQPCVHSLHVQHQQQPQQQHSLHKGLQQQQQQQQQHSLHGVPQQQQPCLHPLPMPQQQQIQVCGSGPGPLCESLTRTSPSPAHSNQAPDTTVRGAGGYASASAAAGAAADGTEAGAAVAAASEPQEASLVHPAAAALGNVCTEMHDAPVHGCAIDGQRNPVLMRLFEAPSNRMPSSTQQGSPMAPDSTSFKQWDMLQHMGSSEHLHHSSFSGVKMEEEEDGGGIIHYIDAPKRLEMDKAHLNMVTADADPERSSLSNRLREMTSMVSWTWKGTKQKVHRLFTHARMQREAAAMFFGADDEGGEGQAGRGLWGNTLQVRESG
ncbi:hypothetical protein DUNSADRAFT_10125 [Dunaliella salina]|uniref:Guanylate cyclase domain-containing protein n=1 Tax=Dunaliella salina TaxID=3046 RepID=A0ABQ7H534_DUNSA|nr:hypothetical protein DUNSADRAFT_10125 [Dunaliella salina]|eukprot:KAF5841954.1 hypothetical protein DUNSADRAFT_10125 [Dunaliella salina]